MNAPLSIAMIAPEPGRCGVADYTAYLLTELERLVEVRYRCSAEQFHPQMNRVDLAHIQHQYFLFGGVAPWKNRFRALADRLRVPAVMTVHEFVSPSGDPLRRFAIALTNRRQFRHPAVRRLIVHTEEDRRRMIASGLDARRMVTVRHGVPPAPRLPPREEARRALAVENRFVLTLFGFLSRRKGHLLVIQALKSLPENAILLLAGGRHPDDSTSYVPDLEALIEREGLAERVRITGYLPPEQVAQVMSATDLVVAPFIESSGSGSLAMALACGKPILASDIAPHREMVQETPGAVSLCAGRDGEAFAAAIRKLQSEPDALAEMAAGAQRYARQHSYARMAAETMEVYRAALEA
jgi:glycosyltransferase involved in cell wall biosynthesis